MLSFLMKWLIPLQTVWASPTPLSLAVGDTALLSPKAPSLVRVANGRVIRAFAKDGRLFIQGKRVGTSVVTHDSSATLVYVLSRSHWNLLERIKNQLSQYEGLTVHVEDEKIVVEGELYRLSDWIDLRKLIRSDQENFLFRAKIWPDLIEETKAHFKGLAQQRGLTADEMSLAPQATLIAPKDRVAAYSQVFKPYGFIVLPSEDLVPAGLQIRMHVTLAEVLKSNSHKLGFDFQDSQSIQLLPKFSTSKEFSTTLMALESAGQARTLARPTLLTRSGSEAEFLSGGEFPVKVGSRYKYEVNWKRHGLWLKLKPTADGAGKIRLAMNIELSSPQPENSTDAIPSLRATRLQNEIDTRNGATVALAGLARKFIGQSRDQIPGLGDIPLLGSLFGSDSFQRHQSDLVIFISTEIQPPTLDEPQKLNEDFDNGSDSRLPENSL